MTFLKGLTFKLSGRRAKRGNQQAELVGGPLERRVSAGRLSRAVRLFFSYLYGERELQFRN